MLGGKLLMLLNTGHSNYVIDFVAVTRFQPSGARGRDPYSPKVLLGFVYMKLNVKHMAISLPLLFIDVSIRVR